jgi:hypothetical protein
MSVNGTKDPLPSYWLSGMRMGSYRKPGIMKGNRFASLPKQYQKMRIYYSSLSGIVLVTGFYGCKAEFRLFGCAGRVLNFWLYVRLDPVRPSRTRSRSRRTSTKFLLDRLVVALCLRCCSNDSEQHQVHGAQVMIGDEGLHPVTKAFVGARFQPCALVAG